MGTTEGGREPERDERKGVRGEKEQGGVRRWKTGETEKRGGGGDGEQRGQRRQRREEAEERENRGG